MSRFEYFLAFETILYGLILAHAVVRISQMIYYRKTIRFYWAHIVACMIVYFTVIQTYYSLFWVSVDTVTGVWSFFLLRMLPLTLHYIITFQIFPVKMEGLEAEKFFYSRIKEILIPIVLFNMLAVAKSIYYRFDQYMELGDGNLFNSVKFWTFVSPSLLLSTIAFLLIFHYQKKWYIEAFVVFSFLITLILMTFGATSK